VTVRALELYRSVPRYVASKAVSSRMPGALAGGVAPLRLVHRDPPARPGPDWVRIRPRLAGICGSDLGTISGHSSFYFSALVSMPFVLGHEVVGELLDDAGGFSAGQRVVIDPVLSCAARGIDPPCGPCAAGEPGLCERVVGGHVRPGLQTGYCATTGGGWSGGFVAHASQLHAVPDGMTNEDAVIVEPLACAVHAVRRADVPDGATVLIAGAGTVGLLTLVALKAIARPGRVLVVAKHNHQAEHARRLGASDVIPPDAALGIVRRATGAFKLEPEHAEPFLLGGADLSFECAGSRGTLALCLRATRGRGRVVLAGMPPSADLSPVWFRELEVVGAYSGSGAFPTAMELAGQGGLGSLVGPVYPLNRWREGIDHALEAGRLGAVKVAFCPTGEE
jgi:threonine dehydrogenase-like Zn-dependent dehydrogenase